MTTIVQEPVVAPQPPVVSDEVRDVLREAKGLVSRGWRQGVREYDGSFCILGAISKAAFGYAQADVFEMWDYLSPLAKHLFPDDLVSFNDTPGRTKAEVVDLFDRALGA